jgi:hypothetical protein
VKRFRRGATGALATCLAVLLVSVLGAAPAHAAVTYWYHPGDAMWDKDEFGVYTLCTGGWGLRLNGEARFATAGHCFYTGAVIFNVQDNQRRNYAVVTESARGSLDAELADPTPDTDAYQIVYGYRVVGKYDNGSFGYGFHVLKYGQTTGLTELSVVGWSTWIYGEPIVCATGGNDYGDSGGPVFTHDSAGRAWAAGMIVGLQNIGGTVYTCFITIDQVLDQFGATLPVFPSWSATPTLVGPGPHPTAFPASLPKLTGATRLIPG